MGVGYIFRANLITFLGKEPFCIIIRKNIE